MLGAVIGNTVGSVYEFNNTEDYNFTLFSSESSYTDDSIMTMAVASWLLSDPELTFQKLEDAMVHFAEAYYKEIPASVAERVRSLLPGEFTRILEAVGERTDYGKSCWATGIPR